MGRTAVTTGLLTGALALALSTTAASARDDAKRGSEKATQASEQARDKAEARDEDRRDADDTLGEAWLVTKIKAQFWDEDALDDSDIDVDAREGVVILRGRVASQTGKTRAVQVARDTEGVTRVDDRLTVGPTDRGDGGDVPARDEADDATAERHEKADQSKGAARDSRETVGTAGETVTDGWITAKVKGTFIGEDALDGSDIDVDTSDGIVTLTGTVASQAGRTRAVAMAKKIEGVKSVKDELRIEKRD